MERAWSSKRGGVSRCLVGLPRRLYTHLRKHHDNSYADEKQADMQKPSLTLAHRLVGWGSWLHLDRLANRWWCRWSRIWRDRYKWPFMHSFSPMGALFTHMFYACACARAIFPNEMEGLSGLVSAWNYAEGLLIREIQGANRPKEARPNAPASVAASSGLLC